MENTPTLHTQRLLLRRFTAADGPALFEILRDEEANRFLPWFPTATLAQAAAHLQAHFLDLYQRPAGYHYAVCLRTDGRPIGYISVADDESRDLGYGLHRDYWRMGIATEAGLALLQRLAADGIPYVTATHDVNNPKSGAVMQRLGMTYRYSYNEQWQPKDIPVTFRLYQRNLDGRGAWTYRRYWDTSQTHFIERLP